MKYETPADRLGASYNLCIAADRVQQSAAAVAAASAARAPAAELAPLRAAHQRNVAEYARHCAAVPAPKAPCFSYRGKISDFRETINRL